MEEQKVKELMQKMQEFDNQSATAAAAAKATAEVQEMAKAAKTPTDILNIKVSENVMTQINTDELVKDKMQKTAGKIIHTGLRTQENKVETEEAASDLELKKEVYENFGIDSKVNKTWKRKLYTFFDDLWDLILGVASGFTIVPITKILKRFSTVSSKWAKGFLVFGVFLGTAAFVGAMVFGISQGINWVKSFTK